MEFPAQEEGGFDFGEGEGDFLPEGEEGVELPPQPKQKPKYFVHWDRRKAKFYDYNYDYGTNYYGSMVRYCDTKKCRFRIPRPPRGAPQDGVRGARYGQLPGATQEPRPKDTEPPQRHQEQYPQLREFPTTLCLRKKNLNFYCAIIYSF